MIPSQLVTKWDGTQVGRIDLQVRCPASQMVTKPDGYQVSWLPSLEGEGKGEGGGCEGEGEWEWN